MIVKSIAFDSPEYRLAVALRHEVLRAPLGLIFSPEDLAPDAGDAHLGAFDVDDLLGCLTLAERIGAAGRLKVRQVAVRPRRQGGGVGRRLMGEAERAARARGLLTLELNARHTAIAFYRALGFVPEGPPFVQLGLPHQPMIKLLGSS